MNLCEHNKGRIIGEIDLFLRRPGQPDDIILRKKNTILNSGMDLAARALAGQQFVNGMYFAYDNDSPAYTDLTPPVERTASFYHSDGGGTRNFDRAGTLAQPSFAATDVQYNGNKATFVAITTGAGQLAGVGNVLTDGTSQFYGAALAWLHPTDYQQDILFSAVSFDDFGPAQFEKIAGAQLGIRWGIYFQQP